MGSFANKMFKVYNKLCNPAKVYLLVSIPVIISMLYQNIWFRKQFKVGDYSVNLNHDNYILFLLQAAYIFIWTFALNELCRNGWGNISWFLVFFPIILMFVLIALLLLANI